MSNSDHSKKMTVPPIDIRAPLTVAAAAMLIYSAVAISAASMTRVETSIKVAGKVVSGEKPDVIRHTKGGTIAEVRVVEGQSVNAGDVLLAFDTTAIDQQLASLKSQSEAVDKQLDVLAAEVATSMDLVKRKMISSDRLKDLNKQLATASADAARLTSEITQSEADLEKAAVRSPISGRVVTLSASSRGAIVLPESNLAEIAPDGAKKVVSVRLSPEQSGVVELGMPARIALAGHTAAASLVWKSAERSTDQRTGEAGYAARVEFDQLEKLASQATAAPVHSHADVTLITGQRQLWQHLITTRLAASEAHP